VFIFSCVRLIWLIGINITTAAPSTDVRLPRLSLELEVLISGYGCFEDGRGTHFGANESGSPEHTVYCSLNLKFKTGINLYIILRASRTVHSTRYPTVIHFSVLCLHFNNCPPPLPVYNSPSLCKSPSGHKTIHEK
jgi:hypothetical protein